ncbi:TonB-dependent receptor domain-containing protein [Poseidonibacter lekithochrous]|uniref:TonB-dependent receptor domain-containing protein n=1 Tax=Poseidonibacter lekithochrous TaxID=1904463 RepID=UPI0008FC6211|nr:TonB-dependent receptor [Poseidonibacter lekithochrous]QKJ23200.1 TonB-dependent receptor [Poseidonibacter lekithochrous]
MNKIQTSSLVAGLLLATNLYSNENLSEITVYSATKSEQSIKDVTSNIDVITKEDIQEKNFNSVSQALNTIPGVNLTSNGGLGQLDNLTIRGVSGKRILVLIDGIRYNETAGLSGANIAQLLIDDIESIEVVKGAQSGIWGADASGGVVNIITSKAKKGLHGNVAVEYGSFHTKKISANVSNRTEKGYIKVGAYRVDTEGYSAFEAKKGSADYGKRGDELGYDKDGYSNNTYNIQAGLNLSDNDLIELLYKKIDSEYKYDNSSSDDTTKKGFFKQYLKSASYTHKSDIYQIKLNAQQSRFDRTQGTFNAISSVNEFALQSDIDYTDNGKLLVGLNKQNFEYSSSELKFNTKAVFLSNSNRFGNLIFAQTLRFDDNSKFKEKITGKIGAKYLVSDDLNVSANYGTAYNAPTLSNLNYTPTLKPETTKSLDLNVEYKNFKVTYFESRITDMIQYVSGSWPNTQYENLDGETKLKGYELSYNKDITENTLLSLNYLHLSAKDNKDQDLSRRAKRELGFAVDYYGFDKFHFNVNGSYVGTRYDGANKTGAETGNYTVWNSVVNYEINKTFSTYLKIDNLFDKYYQNIDGYATPERSGYVGLKATF